jgi:hypothetical protein
VRLLIDSAALALYLRHFTYSLCLCFLVFLMIPKNRFIATPSSYRASFAFADVINFIVDEICKNETYFIAVFIQKR